MSLIRQRNKNLFISWLLGVITVIIIMGIVILLFQKELLVKSTNSIKTEKTYQSVLVATTPIQKGNIFKEEDMTYVELEVGNSISSDITKEMLVGKKSVIDIDRYLPITLSMIKSEDNKISSQRLYEFDYIRLPYLLESGEVVDIRIALPNGQEYVVLSKKNIHHFERSKEDVHIGLISLEIDEEESLSMSSARIDMLLNEDSRIYMVKYTNPENQIKSIVTYPMNQSVIRLLKQGKIATDLKKMVDNRNMLNQALKELFDEDGKDFVEVAQEDIKVEEVSDKSEDLKINETVESVEENQNGEESEIVSW